MIVRVKSRLRQWRRDLQAAAWGARGWFPWCGYRVYAPKGAHLLREVALHGDYERATVQNLIAFSRPDAVGIDVGANLGLISLAVLRVVPKLVVHAYEPSSNTLDYLVRTHAESGLHERWIIHSKACCDEHGEAAFSLSTPAMGAFDGLTPSRRMPVRRETRVATVRLDDEWIAWGRPPVCWVKIDVEGSELRVWRGLEELMQTCRPTILTEWNLVNLAASRTDPGMIFRFANDHRLSVFDPESLGPVCSLEFIQVMLARGKDTFLLVPKERLTGIHNDGAS